MKKTANDYKIAREEDDLRTLLSAMPDNPIPWVAMLKLVGPLIARLAARYALKKAARGLSEDKVNAVGRAVGTLVGDIISARTHEVTQ